MSNPHGTCVICIICRKAILPDIPIKSGDSKIDKFVQSLMEENARVEAEKRALIEEFRKSVPEDWSPEDLKNKLRDLLASAYSRISMTMDNDDQPALAFSAAKYVMSIGIGQIKISDENDPNKEFGDLLKKLQKDPKAPATPSSTTKAKDEETADKT